MFAKSPSRPRRCVVPAALYRAASAFALESLEGRAMLSGTLLVSGTALDDTIRIARNGVNPNQVDVFVNNPGPAPTLSADLTTLDGIQVSGLDGADTFNIEFSQAGVPVSVLGGSGNDTLNIATGAGKLADVAANVSFDGDGGTDTLNVLDTGGTTSDTYTITAGTVARTGMGGVISHTSIDDLNVYAGSGNSAFVINDTAAAGAWDVFAGPGNDTFTLNKSSGATLTLSGQLGNDTFNVTPSTNNLGNILGDVYFNGDNDADTITFNDSANPAASAYELTSSTFTRNPLGQLSYTSFDTLTINAGSGDIGFTIANTSNFTSTTVNAGAGNGTFVVENSSMSSTLVVNAGAGNDAFIVSPSGQLIEQLAGPVTLNGQGDNDSITFNDQGDSFPDTYTLSATAVTRSFMGVTSYAGIEAITLVSGSGAATFNVASTSATLNLQVGAGNDAVNLTPGGQNLDALAGALTIVGDGGSDTLTLNDQANASDQTYTINAGTIARTSWAVPLAYTTLDTITINGGPGRSTFIHNATSAALSLAGNAGNDSLTAHAPLSAPITYAGGSQTSAPGDVLSVVGTGASAGVYSPSATTPGNGTFTVDGQPINFTGLEPVAASAFNTLKLITPNAADAIALDRPAAGQTRVSGTSGGVAFEALTFFDSKALTLDVGSNDAGAGNDTITIDSNGIAATLFQTLTVNAGTGVNALTINGGAFALDTNAGPAIGKNLAVTLNNAAQVSLGASQDLASLTLNATSRVNLQPNGSRVLYTKALSINGGASAPTARLNLEDNALIIDYASGGAALRDTVTRQINVGRDGYDVNIITKWTGNGIVSTTARTQSVAAGFDLYHLGVMNNADLADPSIGNDAYTVFRGHTVDASSVLVRYTYSGDGNLNGLVDGDDYALIDNAFNLLIPNFGWLSGDFDYEGNINGDDYALIDSGFLFQGLPLGI